MKPFVFTVSKFCRCMDLRPGLIFMGILGVLFFSLSLSFGILAATVEALSARETAIDTTGATEDEQTLTQQLLELAGDAQTASGFETRTNFGFPFYDFAVGFVATLLTFFTVFIRDNRQQQVCAILAAALYLTMSISEFVGFVLAIAYASGCSIGDNKCVTVGGITCMYFLCLIPIHFHFFQVCNAWRERLGGRALNDILFGDLPKPTRQGMPIGKGSDMPMNNMQPMNTRPQLAVPPGNNFSNASPRPNSQVGSMQSQAAPGGLPPRGPPSMAPSGMSNFSMQQQQMGLNQAAQSAVNHNGNNLRNEGSGLGRATGGLLSPSRLASIPSSHNNI